MSKIRVTRTLVYEGEESWVRQSLSRKVASYNCDLVTPRGRIKETRFVEEKLLSPAEEAWQSWHKPMFFRESEEAKNTFIAGYHYAQKKKKDER